MHKINKAHQVRLMTLESSWRMVGLISCGGLALLILCMAMPIVTSSTNAVESRITTTDSIALAISPNVDIDLTPTAEGSFGATTVAIRVASSSNAGYSLYVNTADGTTSMVNTDANQTASIAPVAKDSKATEFTNNTWGFSIDQATADTNTTYQAVPAVSTKVLSSNQANANDQLYLHVGAKIDTALPAGQYSNNLVVSAVAHPSYVTGLMSLTYMQDMTSNICQDTKAANGANTVTPGNEVEKRLIDVRDGKEYWVAKLADGNCWMTQNLALDLNEKTLPLKPETSDIDKSWAPSVYTSTTVPSVEDSENLHLERSWGFGKYILKDPDTTQACDTVPTGQPLDSCNTLVNVNSSDWQSTTLDSSVDVASKLYDAHYLIGNYYSWYAATAGSGVSLAATPESDISQPAQLKNAPASLCPKGWQMPRSGRNTSTTSPNYGRPFDVDDSFFRLFRAYGYPDSNKYITTANGFSYTPLLTQKYQNATRPPMYFIGSGLADINRGAIRYLGLNGSYWSATVNSSDWSFNFTVNINASTVAPATQHGYAIGYNIRCLVK